MRVVIKDHYQDVAIWLAEYIAAKINSFQPTSQRPFVLGLATGSSPIAIYQHWIKMYQAKKLSFEHVITFNMDEYVGLAQDHPESYYSFMWRNLFSHIDIKKENVHILNGNATNLKQECTNYENAINLAGGIEFFLGGMGVDGHIAFNEPGTSLHSLTHKQKLTYETRLVNSRFFDNDMNKVPEYALTVGVGTVMASKEVGLITTGHNKARALQQTIEGGISQMWTASALQIHQHALIVCDEAACAELKLGTYRYYKEMN